MHIRAYRKHAERPALEDNVSYALSTDKRGRPCAVKVKKAGEKRPAKNYSGYILIALSFLLVVGVSVLAAGMPVEVSYLYLVASMITFLIYSKDTSAARGRLLLSRRFVISRRRQISGWCSG